MAYNGYRNFETWLFMLYFEHDIYEIVKERHQNEKINYETVYETVEHIIEEISESIDRVEFGYAFVKELIGAALSEIDKKEVADHVIRDLNDEN